MGMGVLRKNQPNVKVGGRIGEGDFDFCSRRLGWGWQGTVCDEVWKVKDFLPDFGEFVMLVGHPHGDEKMFRYMDLGGHRHE